LSPHAALLDRERVTVARCMEAALYGQWLREERARIEGGPVLGGGYTWAGTDAESAEWLLEA